MQDNDILDRLSAVVDAHLVQNSQPWRVSSDHANRTVNAWSPSSAALALALYQFASGRPLPWPFQARVRPVGGAEEEVVVLGG